MTEPRPTHTFLSRARASRTLTTGLVLTTLIVLLAVCAPIIAPYSPSAQDLTAGLLAPSPAHWFGTDQLGRDVLSRMLFAAQTDLRIAVFAAATPFVMGVLIGMISGYFGKATGWIASRAIDIVIAFPFYVMVIAIVFAIGAGERGIIVAFAIVGWVGYARVLSATTASLRESGWVRAARGGGLSHVRVMLRHALPNVLPQAIVLLMTEIVLIMVAIVTLGYLGLGVQPPTPDWGTMIADGQQFVTSSWWLSALPGLAVVVTGIALSLVGDGIGDAMRVSSASGSAGGGASGVARSAASGAGRGAALASEPGDHGPSTPSKDSAVTGAISITNLTIATGTDTKLVTSISLAVAPGEAVGLVGESGSGKSLTLRAVLGMLPPGTRIAGGNARAVGRVGMVFQDPMTALDPLTRVGSQLVEIIRAQKPRVSRAVARQRADSLLRDVQLDTTSHIFRAYPHDLSGGQRQRIVIAIALAQQPDVLLCDEPTTSLDVTVQQQILHLLDSLRRERGLTLLFVSHDLAVVASVCSRIAVMKHGEFVESGDTKAITQHPQHPYTMSLLAAIPQLPVPAGAADPEPRTEQANPTQHEATA